MECWGLWSTVFLDVNVWARVLRGSGVDGGGRAGGE